MIALKIPHETARLLGSIDVPGTKTPLDQMHVTLLYLGEEVPIQQIAKAVVAAYRVTSCRTPFNVKTSKVKCFPVEAGAAAPIIAPVISNELQEFHNDLKKAFDKLGVVYSKKFPEYKPHVTLAYAEKPIKCVTLDAAIQWAAHEATLYGGDFGDDRLTTVFPFVLKPTKAGFYSSVVKPAKRLGNTK